MLFVFLHRKRQGDGRNRTCWSYSLGPPSPTSHTKDPWYWGSGVLTPRGANDALYKSILHSTPTLRTPFPLATNLPLARLKLQRFVGVIGAEMNYLSGHFEIQVANHRVLHKQLRVNTTKYMVVP